MATGARRRSVLGAGAAFALSGIADACAGSVSGNAHGSAETATAPLRFPRDHGSHPDFATEWWYITGHVQAQDRAFGFQITFFRSRVETTQTMHSQFAARQLLFAHAAVTDVQERRLLHDQRIARSGFGIAQALTGDADVRLRDWSLVREGESYTARIVADDFGLDLVFRPTQPVLLQGSAGRSRKGPLPDNMSYYYSQPQLAVGGRIRVGANSHALPESQADGPLVHAAAWLDREWSQTYLHRDAVGWDWIGMNFDDGSALMAFRIRDRAGNAFWDGGSFRAAGAEPRVFERGETFWKPLRRWTSAASGAAYPVEWELQTPAGAFGIQALVDNQELDSRRSTGAIYWEGLSELTGAQGRRVGRGYLEMTGYASALRI